MKKNLILILMVTMLFSCAGCVKDENKELLIGEWALKSDTLFNHHEYTFNGDGKVEYYECLDFTICLGEESNSCKTECRGGSGSWEGTYKIKDNIVTLYGMKIEDESNLKYDNIGPSEKLIVDFDNMYMCDRNKGLDCKNKFEKDHDPDDYENEDDE